MVLNLQCKGEYFEVGYAVLILQETPAFKIRKVLSHFATWSNTYIVLAEPKEAETKKPWHAMQCLTVASL